MNENLVYILSIICLTSCYKTNVTEKESKLQGISTDSSMPQNTIVEVSSPREPIADNFNCGERTIALDSNFLDMKYLSKYFSLTLFTHFDRIDTFLTNSSKLYSLKLPTKKIKPIFETDSISLGDCLYIIGEFKSPHLTVQYLVFSDYSESEYRNTIRVFSINQKGAILDIEDFAEFSGDGGDSYNTSIKQISPTIFEYTVTETHLADNENMDTISTNSKKGLIELEKNGMIIRTQAK